MGRYDRHGKWMIGQHGDAILRLGGLAEAIVSWHAAQAEVVEPAKLPDGFLEVQFAGRTASDAFIVEITTYADRQVYEQLQRDVALVYAQRKIVPEVLVVALRPNGQVDIGPSHALSSRLGWTRWETSWRVVRLWQVPETELWALGDPGIVPWIPLCRLERPPETVVDECRTQIERYAPPRERENLLVVTQIFTWLRFKDNQLLQRLGGRKMIEESDLIQEIVQEQVQERRANDLLLILETRFGTLPSDLAERLKHVQDEGQWKQILRSAGQCRDLGEFQAALNR